jgi:hypothetical protein
MNNQTKVVLGAIAAVFGISLIARFVVLSQAGLSGMWIFYLGLPIGGVVTVLLLLLRLGVLNFGESHSGTVQHWQQSATAPPPRPWAAPTSQRLQELEELHSSGAISDVEYGERRARIIADI